VTALNPMSLRYFGTKAIMFDCDHDCSVATNASRRINPILACKRIVTVHDFSRKRVL